MIPKVLDQIAEAEIVPLITNSVAHKPLERDGLWAEVFGDSGRVTIHPLSSTSDAGREGAGQSGICFSPTGAPGDSSPPAPHTALAILSGSHASILVPSMGRD
jgi:hypothetical protein